MQSTMEKQQPRKKNETKPTQKTNAPKISARPEAGALTHSDRRQKNQRCTKFDDM